MKVAFSHSENYLHLWEIPQSGKLIGETYDGHLNLKVLSNILAQSVLSAVTCTLYFNEAVTGLAVQVCVLRV